MTEPAFQRTHDGLRPATRAVADVWTRLGVPAAPEWHTQAACRGHDPELFFTNGSYPQATYDICQACPVRIDCLEHAIANDEQGMWGGTSERDRRALTRLREAGE